jgi:hypothetical protein
MARRCRSAGGRFRQKVGPSEQWPRGRSSGNRAFDGRARSRPGTCHRNDEADIPIDGRHAGHDPGLGVRNDRFRVGTPSEETPVELLRHLAAFLEA